MEKLQLATFGSVVLLLAACAGTTPSIGDTSAKTVATGSAGGASTQGANTALEHCSKALGTVAFHEDVNEPWFQQFASEYKTNSTLPVLRLIVQQSGCFVIVERGRAMANMQQERALGQQGELRSSNNFSKGQMVAADYTLSPSVTFSERGTSGLSAMAAHILPIAGWLGGGAKSNEASTMLLMTDNRSGVQLAAAEGSAKNWDFNAFGALFGGFGFGGASGFTKTPQGKVLVAAFMDSYNQMVKAVRSYKAQTVAGGLGNGGNMPVGN